MGLTEFLRELRELVNMYPDVQSIARRMFVTNSIDSIITALGVSVGGYGPEGNPRLLGLSVMGGGMAMGLISAMLGVYLSERAERMREYHELEKKLAASLRNSVYWRAARIIPVYVALWSGIGATIFPILIALPYLLTSTGLLPFRVAYYSSLLAGLGSLGFLGYYLSRVSGENPLHSIARLLGMGLLAIIVVSAFKIAVA
jgi:predicted membrane protein (TIGR00267 family)